jgi:hypothetical protein
MLEYYEKFQPNLEMRHLIDDLITVDVTRKTNEKNSHHANSAHHATPHSTAHSTSINPTAEITETKDIASNTTSDIDPSVPLAAVPILNRSASSLNRPKAPLLHVASRRGDWMLSEEILPVMAPTVTPPPTISAGNLSLTFSVTNRNLWKAPNMADKIFSSPIPYKEPEKLPAVFSLPTIKKGKGSGNESKNEDEKDTVIVVKKKPIGPGPNASASERAKWFLSHLSSS